jgi:hypothetical protein
MLVIISPESEVEIGPTEAPIIGVVIQVAIHPQRAIQYQVAWWCGLERKEQWMDACEVRVSIKSIRTEIGFLGGLK